jgi:hypothetical protein
MEISVLGQRTIIGNRGPLNLDVRNVSRLVADFSIFLKFDELDKQLKRIKKKVSGLVRLSDQIAMRYETPLALAEIYRRRKLNQTAPISDRRIHNAIAFIAGSLEAAAQMNEAARSSFRSRILAALRPDRDFRSVEHEVRCFTHFRQANYAVRFADLEGFGRYDFLATRGADQVEIECKMISPDIGYSIKLERSISIFEEILRLISSGKIESIPVGIYQIELSTYDNSTLMRVSDCFHQFVRHIEPQAQRELFSGIRISFDARPQWQALKEMTEAARFEFIAEQERLNSNCIVTNAGGGWCVISLAAERRPRIIKGIINEIKSAADQLSKSRAGLIWVHFGGWSEAELRIAAQHAKERADSPFNIISTHILRNDTRNHVSAIWYSATGSELLVAQHKAGTMTKGSGPIYMIQSHRTQFPLPAGLALPK